MRRLILITACLMFCTGIARANITEGLLGWWKMEEATGANVIDSSGKGNVGTPINSPVSTSGCPRGKCLSFNGTNHSISVTTVDLSATNVVSFSFWLYQDVFDASDGAVLEATTNVNTHNTGFLIVTNNSFATVGIAIGLVGNTGLNLAIYSPPSAKAWHHYVGLLDKSRAGNEEDLYIDGVLQTPISRPFNVDNTNNFGNDPIYIMSRAGTSGFVKATIDDVRIYNRALSPQEITDLYNEGCHWAGGKFSGGKLNQ